jgi:polar amino acid transport system substrate-binding protein
VNPVIFRGVPTQLAASINTPQTFLTKLSCVAPGCRAANNFLSADRGWEELMWVCRIVRPVVVAVLVVGLVAASGCAKSDRGQITSSGVKLVRTGTLTVCTHLPFEPFQYRDDTGRVVGFDIDLIELVAQKLGTTQSVVDTPFEGIKSGQDLNSGKCDVAAAGMTITAERQQALDFSVPYFDANQALLVRADAAYTSLADLRGKRLGTQAATTGEDYGNQHAQANGYTTVSFRDLAALQQALATKQVDAAIDDLPVVAAYVRHNPGSFVVSAQFETGERYGYAVRKNSNPALLASINQAIEQARQDGTYERIYAKWIGGPRR